jgi:DedD protein
MNDGFRQRLVGAIVLVCLALIVWPIIFSDSSRPVVDRRSQIPPMPEFEKYSIPEPAKPRQVEPVATDVVTASNVQSQKSSAAAKQKQLGLDQRGLPVSWVLQVASFSQQKNASELVAKLQKRGYKAYEETATKDGKTISRVFVGPKLDKSALEKIKKDIDQSFKVKSIISRYSKG